MNKKTNRFENSKLVSYEQANDKQICVVRIPNHNNNKKILKDFEIDMVGNWCDVNICVFSTDIFNLSEFLLSQFTQVLSMSPIICGVENDLTCQKNTKVTVENMNTNVVGLAQILIEYFEPIVDGRSYQK